MTKMYFRATSHHGDEALKQIMEKQNRIEHLQDIGAHPTAITIKCSNCSKAGHNMLTCSEPCVSCQFSPFKAHLVERAVSDKKQYYPSCM